MCELCEQHNLGRASGRYAHEAYPLQNAIRLYSEVEAGKCALTGALLSHHYIHNAGQCTKPFKEEIYQHIIGQRREICFFCRRTPLSQEKVSGQYSQPREVSNHFCPECIEYIGLLARKVAGYDNSFLLDEQRFNQLPAPNRRDQTYRHDDDVEVIDAEYHENEPRRLEYVPRKWFADFFKNSKKNAQDLVYVRYKD